MRVIAYSVLVYLLSFQLSYCQEIFPTLTGDALLLALQDEYKTGNVLSYSDARTFMYTDLDNVNDSVVCIYTDHRRYLDPNAQNPIQFVLDNGQSNGINAEHVYPQSKGAGTGQPRSDLHHLFPARVNANSARGSSPLAEIPDNRTSKWYLEDDELTTIPTLNIDAYTELGSGQWEPREPIKGDIARAVLYFYTMYKEEADAADPDYFQLQLQDVCAWHYEDPADDKERDRNRRIAEIQGKENPFILDCTLASRSHCSDFSQDCPLINSIANPTEHDIRAAKGSDFVDIKNIPTNGDYEVDLYLASGQMLMKQSLEVINGTIRLSTPSTSIKNALLIIRLREHVSNKQYLLKVY